MRRPGFGLLTSALSFVIAAQAHAMTTSQWMTFNDEYRTGYVSALAREKMHTVQLGPHWEAIRQGYIDCLGDKPFQELLRGMSAYLQRNPAANNNNADMTVNLVINEMCKPYINARISSDEKIKGR